MERSTAASRPALRPSVAQQCHPWLHHRMKLSVSLTEDDLRILDEFARQHHLPSRSSAVQRAVRALRHDALVEDDVAAFTEWRAGDGATWDAVTGDGLDDAPR